MKLERRPGSHPFLKVLHQTDGMMRIEGDHRSVSPQRITAASPGYDSKWYKQGYDLESK